MTHRDVGAIQVQELPVIEGNIVIVCRSCIRYSNLMNGRLKQELVLEDSPITDNADSQSQKKEKDKESSLLYRISKYKTFSLFQKIILVSCPKDQYVPFYSARIQVR